MEEDYSAFMRRWPLKTAFVLSGIVLLVAICWPQSEPHYQGKPLSVWLRGFESDNVKARGRSAEAVRQLGTNALPQLIAQLREPVSRGESRWRQCLRTLLSKQSFIKITIPRPPDTRIEALAALDALGPNAGGAVPALEDLLHDNPPEHRALLVLAGIGPEAIPALTRALTNNERAIQLGARVCLNARETRSSFLFPKSAEDAEFMRKSCAFNATVLRAAFEEYRAQHPEQVSPDGIPRPVLPPDFTSPELRETNALPPVLPTTSGYE